MGKKSSSTSMPKEYGEALQKQAEVAERQQEWYENTMYPWLVEQTNISNQNAQADREFNQANAEWWQNYAKEQSDRQNAIADEYYQRQKDYYQPIEDKLRADAARYNDGVEAERQAEYAIGDIASSFATQRQANKMRAEAYGLNPTSGAYQAQQNALNIQQASMQAAAANQARNAAQTLGWNKNLQLAQLGQAYIGAAQGMYSTANQSGSTGTTAMQNSMNAASNNSQSALGNVSNIANIGLNSYQSMSNAWGQMANTAISGYSAQQNAIAQQQANRNDMMGTIIGAASTAAVAF